MTEQASKEATKPEDSDKPKRTLYDHGLPFNKELARNLDEQKNRVCKLGKASMIIVDGSVGEGKTTLAIECADYLEGKHIELKEQLGMGGVNFTKAFLNCQKHQHHVCIYDEAGDYDRRGALTRLNRLLNRTFDVYRTYHIVVILTLPTFDLLDSSLLHKGIPRMLLHCRDRTPNQGTFFAYDLAGMHVIKYKMSKKVIKAQAYSEILPNFRGHFLDLTPSRSKELDTFTTRGKTEILEASLIRAEGLLTLEEMAARIGVHKYYLSRMMNKAGLKPTRIIKQVRYYNESQYESAVRIHEKI